MIHGKHMNLKRMVHGKYITLSLSNYEYFKRLQKNILMENILVYLAYLF